MYSWGGPFILKLKTFIISENPKDFENISLKSSQNNIFKKILNFFPRLQGPAVRDFLACQDENQGGSVDTLRFSSSGIQWISKTVHTIFFIIFVNIM